jgi:transcription-repair coupling factor (superfamily II helicase)
MQASILHQIQTLPAFQRLIEKILERQPVENLGLPRAARIPVLAAIQDQFQKPVLLITDRSDRSLQLEQEWGFWQLNLKRLFFPEPDPLYYERIPWSRRTRQDRIDVLAHFAGEMIPAFRGGEEASGLAVVAPIRSLITRTLPRREFLKHSRVFRTGDIQALASLAASWYRIGYEPTSVVVSPGQFARRGGILDIWPPAEQFPVRFEFFGDQVDMLRVFDPRTQRTIGKISEVLVTPAREFIIPENGAEQDYLEADIPMLYQEQATLLNYLTGDCLVLIDDLDSVESTIREIDNQAGSMRTGYIRDGTLMEEAPYPYLSQEVLEGIPAWQNAVCLGPLHTSSSQDLAGHFSLNPRFGGELKSFTAHVAETVRGGSKAVVVSRQAARLEEIWTERSASAASPRFLKGSLENGFQLAAPDQKTMVLFSDGEIFGWGSIQPRQQPVRRAKAPELKYTDFQIGDWVVHVDHGIGRYAGLVERELGGAEGEYLAIEYAEGDRLYVPVSQADRVTRYVGPDHHDPQITRLGSTRWSRTKRKVEREVFEVAEDLLRLYASRQTAQGYAFSPDTPWQQELEASFPYIETDDQLQVLSQVKKDMESPRPMDRLICGDVGYGKTEIAVRAAFKAVMDGKQVAILVPTTVLAQQHYETFQERTSAFPVEIRMLSRFQTPAQQRQIVAGLKVGAVDVVIGTHRLLSNDIRFSDLGLLIVDEEQRFGVSHKEKIKKMRTNIDVLTMTATPIPRTMYMALTGIRDISRINTPPEERLPVVTRVGPYDPELIQKAIWREMERGGQVFFVHNRVRTIDAMKSHLKHIVPGAKIGVAHGQMAENTLAERMREFTAGEIDVLLSTSIIESGLDIPNANTIIIDRADMFGLAQLYQLRGRVGRGAQRAYAYFLKQRQGSPTSEGRLRLETIAEHTELGAGYSVAMRDLEIRGAGDILGTRQSGNIAAVGFHLYTRLLSQAVKKTSKTEDQKRELQFSSGMEQPLVRVDLPLAAGIPSDYIVDQNVRLSLYRRMAHLESEAEIEELREEFQDRFGPPPITVEHLFLILKIKNLAGKLGVDSINQQDGQILLNFPEEHPLPQPWMTTEPTRFGESTIWLSFDLNTPDWEEKLLGIMTDFTRKD